MKKYILILCCLINNFSFSQYNSSKSDSIFSSYANEKQYMGNVLVAKGKKIIYQNSFGYSDIDNKIKMDSNSIFYLASLAKPITASAILWLEQERKLNTRDKITKYLKLPEYNLTIEHLLTHTSGFGDLYQTIKKYGDTNTVYGNKKLIKLIYKVKPKLESPIGSKWFYSDINYILLASIIERVSGERYEECIRNIFYKNSIYNLEKSSLLLNKVKKTKLSKGFKIKNDSLKIAIKEPEYAFVKTLQNFYGDGGLFGSIKDLNHWASLLYNDTLFKNSTQEKMFKPYTYSNNEYVKTPWGSSQCYMWERDMNSNIVNGAKGGDFIGYMGMIVVFPEKELTIIVLSNVQNDNFWTISSKVYECIE